MANNKLGQLTGKRLLIDKANASMLAMTGAASFIVVFSLVASKALLSQSSYQARVIKKKTVALKQLRENEKNAATLVSSYKVFASSPENILGGSPTGTGPLDGDNPKIVLDALPSKYDFPGLISSLEKLSSSGDYKILTVSGNDDEVAQQNPTSTGPSQPVAMPLSITVQANYQSIQSLLNSFERSIRPIQLNTLKISADATNKLTASMDLTSYYQPESKLTITTEVVK